VQVGAGALVLLPALSHHLLQTVQQLRIDLLDSQLALRELLPDLRRFVVCGRVRACLLSAVDSRKTRQQPALTLPSPPPQRLAGSCSLQTSGRSRGESSPSASCGTVRRRQALGAARDHGPHGPQGRVGLTLRIKRHEDPLKEKRGAAGSAKNRETRSLRLPASAVRAQASPPRLRLVAS